MAQIKKSTNKIAKKIENESTDRLYGTRTDAETRIRDVVSGTIQYYIDFVFPEAFEIIKQKVLFSADVEYQIKKLTGESNLQHKIYPLIDPTHDTFVANLQDAETAPVIIPRDEEAIPLKDQAVSFYDWSESVSGIKEAEEMAGSEAALVGTSYTIFGTKAQEVFEGVNTPLDDQKPTVTELPSTEHVSFFELFCEPGCTNFYNSRYKARRKLATLNQIHEMYPYIDFTTTRETSLGESVLIDDFIERTCGEGLYTWDFKRIRQIKDYENTYKNLLIARNADWDLFDASIYEDMFKVVRGEGGIHEVIEYWSGENLVIMINGYILYDGDNPYGNIDPFGIITYERMAGTYRGRGLGHKLMPLQKEANMLFSSVNNGIKMHLFPDYAISKGGLKEVGGADISSLKWRGGKVYEIPQGNVLSSEPFKAIHFVEYDILALANRRLQEIRFEAMEIIGTNSYTQGGQGNVERSASAVSARVATLRTRLNPIVESMNRMRQRSFYVWMYIAAVSYPKEILVRLVNDEDVIFKTIKPSDIINKFDILIDRETAISIRRGEAMANTIQTLNALTPYLVDQNGLPTIDPRKVLEKTLGDSLMTDIKALDEQGVKDMMDMKINVEKYIAEKTQPAQQIPQMGGGGGQPSREEINMAAGMVPPEGMVLSEDELAQFGM